MVEGENGTMDRGQNRTAAQKSALAETLGPDGGPQTPKSAPGAALLVQTENSQNPEHFDEKWFILLPHVLGPKYERRQRPRNSKGFRIGESQGNLSHDLRRGLVLVRQSSP